MRVSSICIILSLMLGCQSLPGQLAPASYLSWMEERHHGWVESKELGDFEFEVFLHPNEYQLLKTHRDSVLDQAAWEALRQQQQIYQYATLRIKSTDGKTPVLRNGIVGRNDYEGRVGYLAFGLQQALTLSQDGESVACQLYHFERSFDLAPFITCIMAFPAFEEEGEIQFLFEDTHFGNGPIRLTFSKDRFQSTPTVKYPSYASHISK